MVRRLAFLFFGLFLFSLGIVLTVKSNLGTGPWDAFHLGLIRYLPLTFGQMSQLTGVIVILISMFLGMKPGWGTLANMYFIGLFLDWIMAWGYIITPENLIMRLIMLLGGVWIIGWASYFYLMAALGAGPRDSFMVGMIRTSGWPVWKIRTIIETGVALMGYFLGGPVGVGTLIIAFTLGPSIQWAFQLMGRRAQDIQHDSFLNRKGKVS